MNMIGLVKFVEKEFGLLSNIEQTGNDIGTKYKW